MRMFSRVFSVVATAVLLAGLSLPAGGNELPVSGVVLYSSGVGYIQHTGKVKGSAVVEMSFKADQVNDLLKSLVLMDLDGGRVGMVSYGARDPVSRTLESFMVNITDNPSMGNLLNRLRGVRAEISAAGNLEGSILGVEKRRKIVDKEVFEDEYLNLVTAEGLKSIRLSEISSLRLMDDNLNRELNQALSVLAAGLDNQRKPVSVSFNGNGERRVMVGYITQMPLWKTSYRLVTGNEQALLQGWAVVENTSDQDWNNVRLALVSGRPISFIQDLYTPLYLQRPVVVPELFRSLMPVNYSASLEVGGRREQAEAVPGRAREMLNKVAAAPMMATGAVAADAVGGAFSMQETAASSVQSMAGASDLGQAFEYRIGDPVTLKRQQSAMLPIFSGSVPVTQVSIYNSAVQSKHPLYGLKLKNVSGLHLMGGPVTIYNGQNYAGDATFEDLQPGEERLVSYALDLGVEAERRGDEHTQQVTGLKLARGVLQVSRKLRRTAVYTFNSKDGKARQLLVEHPLLAGWELKAPLKADERTRDLYRFNLSLPEAKTAKLEVVQERIVAETYSVATLDTPALLAYSQTGGISPAVKQALGRVAEMQSRLQEIRRQRVRHDQEIKSITDEQSRLRENMSRLNQSSDLYKRYVTKLDEQETLIEGLRRQIAALKTEEDRQLKELESYVGGLNLE